MNSSELQVLLESYKIANEQQQMRIQQRDTFAIQMIVTLGALIGVVGAIGNQYIQVVCMAVIPYVCTYFCGQIFSSYEVHHRLVYYMKNVLEPQISSVLSSGTMMWENFCGYDRRIIKKSKIGGREDFFKRLNIIVPMVVLFATPVLFFTQGSNLGITDISFLLIILVVNVVAIVWSLNVNRHYSPKVSYETMMKDEMAKCGYLVRNPNNMVKKQKAVFLDRDGTIIVDKVETRRLEDLEFFEDIQSLQKLKKMGFLLVIITNQSGIGKKHYTVEEMTNFNDYMISELKKLGVEIDALYYCPHTTQDNCQCKKPKSGMFKRAMLELNIELSESYIIGDQNWDILAGINAGLSQCYAVPTGLYPNNPSGKFEYYEPIRSQTILCESLSDAVSRIASRETALDSD